MYDAISNIINHNWITQGSGEQQYIYYICAAVIVLLVIFVLDLIKKVIFFSAGKR